MANDNDANPNGDPRVRIATLQERVARIDKTTALLFDEIGDIKALIERNLDKYEAQLDKQDTRLRQVEDKTGRLQERMHILSGANFVGNIIAAIVGAFVKPPGSP